MSRRKWCWTIGLAALVMVIIVALGGAAVYYLGWSQGYQLGQSATGSEGGVVWPIMHPRSSLLGAVFALGLILVVLMFVGRTFRFLFWSTMMAYGPRPMGRRWVSHYHHGHRRMPPWFWGWEEPCEEGSEESDAQSQQAEA